MKRVAKWVLVPLLAAILAAIGAWFFFPAKVQAGAGHVLLRYLAFRSDTGSFEGGFTIQKDLRVAMRDGVHLATDLYLPDSAGAHPALVIRTPYTKGEAKPLGEFFARYGYAVVVQDTRGRHKSDGDFYPFRHEAADGRDLTLWIKAQPWCNGKIGGFGASYLGFTQWAMAADNPDLTSISPTFITANLYNGLYSGGAFGKLTFLHWSLTSYGRFGNMAGAKSIAKGYAHFPLVDSDNAALRDIEFFNEWVQHPTPDPYWRSMNPDERMYEMTTPAFMVAGWYDFFRDAQIRDFQKIRDCGSGEARTKSKILIGPWSHGFYNAHSKGYGVTQGIGEILPFEYVRESKAWLDYSLKGMRNGWDDRAPLRVYVLGRNEWRDAHQWPPAEASPQAFYLHSAGRAASLAGDGSLTAAPASGNEPADPFQYDPRNPVPTVGGNQGDAGIAGPADQRKVEERMDVLVYSSELLAKPLLAMGMVKATVFASSSAPDTDFTAKLVDVQPDGRAIIICEGVLRARYRTGLASPQFLKPGAVERFDIEVGNTAVMFGAGHRIRLEISSSNSPRYDANPNTGREIATEREPMTAAQKVFHGVNTPSALYLPVVP